jgi:7SK snRNA methylphosphate capping enzyme
VVASTSAKPKSKPFPHGNYDSYYSHRDPLSFSLPTTDLDPRLAKWNPAWFRGKRVLDIGCNSGIITCGLAARFDPELVLGLDIDPSLISKAQSFLALRYSYCSPLLALEEDSDGVKARKLAQKVEKTSYFPASAIASFGSLPLVRLDKIPLLEPDGTKRSLSGFPFNVRFAVSDFTSSLVSNDSAANPPSTAELTGSHSSSFDTILALAVTKWVHLNGGDPALLAFFRKVHGVLCPGGVFIMEAQPWSSYLKRVEPVELMQLKVRPEGFREMLEGMGFEMVERIGVDAGTDADDSGGEAAEDEGQRKKQKTGGFFC